MKATFEDFLKENPNCRGLENSIGAKKIFDILSEDKNIIKMTEIVELGYPALAPCMKQVEEYSDNMDTNFNDSFPKTAVGKIVQTILKPFGYESTSQKEISQSYRGAYFKSASCYKKTGKAKMEVVITKEIKSVDF